MKFKPNRMGRASVAKIWKKIIKKPPKNQKQEKKTCQTKKPSKKKGCFKRGGRTPQANINVYLHSYIMYEYRVYCTLSLSFSHTRTRTHTHHTHTTHTHHTHTHTRSHMNFKQPDGGVDSMINSLLAAKRESPDPRGTWARAHWRGAGERAGAVCSACQVRLATEKISRSHQHQCRLRFQRKAALLAVSDAARQVLCTASPVHGGEAAAREMQNTECLHLPYYGDPMATLRIFFCGKMMPWVGIAFGIASSVESQKYSLPLFISTYTFFSL